MTENIMEQEQCHILNLNDDCFFHLYKYLPLIDWCALRETCTRLQSISDVCFQRQYKSLELKAKFMYASEINFLSVVDVKRLIRNFGRFVSKLTINSSSFLPSEKYPKSFAELQTRQHRINKLQELELVNIDLKLIPLLHRYCNELQDLTLANIDFDSVVIEQCKRLFSNLCRLVIDRCIDDDATFSTCISHCGSLKELELIGLENVEGHCLANNFKTLVSFSMNSCQYFRYHYIREFFVKNSQLKTLKILWSIFKTEMITSRLFQDVYNNLENLEEISLSFYRCEEYATNVANIGRLSKLKKFEIDFGHVRVSINALLIHLAAKKNIDNLHLASCVVRDNEITRTLCEFKTMKILKFTSASGLDRDIFKKLASQLPALIEIQIIKCANVTFSDLTVFVQHSTNLKKIVFKTFDETSSLKPDIISSLIEALQQKNSGQTLNIHLSDEAICDIKNDFLLARMLIGQAHMIKFLPLDEESITAVYEFGSGFRRP